MNGRLVGLAVTASLVAGCAPAGEAAPETRLGLVRHAISGGVEDTTSKAVMAITHPSSGSLCTGALIAPNALLTARHCVSPVNGGTQVIDCTDSTFGEPYDPASFFVTSADVVDVGNVGEFLVTAVLSLPEEQEPSSLCGSDVAMLVLAELVPESLATPYVPRLDDDPLVAGEVYDAVGYGATDGAGNGAGTRRRLDGISVDCVSDGCADHSLFGAQTASTEWVGAGGVCQGDSGGPALDASDRVVGVTSRGAVDCGATIYGYTVSWTDWLRDSVVYASGVGVYQAPSWTEGSNVDPEYSYPIGDPCESHDECPSGKCVDDTGTDYCTRACADEAPCPEFFVCEERPKMGDVCVAQGPEPPKSYTRADDGGCVVVGPGSRSSSSSLGGWLLLVALGLWRRRTSGTLR